MKCFGPVLTVIRQVNSWYTKPNKNINRSLLRRCRETRENFYSVCSNAIKLKFCSLQKSPLLNMKC